MLKTKIVCFDFKDRPVALTLSESTGRMSVKRGFLSIQGEEANKIKLKEDDVPIDVMFIRSTMYPDMLAPVVNAANLDLPKTPDEFVELLEQLPEQAVTKWNEAVYELNPHWREAEETADVKKKEPGDVSI